MHPELTEADSPLLEFRPTYDVTLSVRKAEDWTYVIMYWAVDPSDEVSMLMSRLAKGRQPGISMALSTKGYPTIVIDPALSSDRAQVIEMLANALKNTGLQVRVIQEVPDSPPASTGGGLSSLLGLFS